MGSHELEPAHLAMMSFDSFYPPQPQPSPSPKAACTFSDNYNSLPGTAYKIRLVIPFPRHTLSGWCN